MKEINLIDLELKVKPYLKYGIKYEELTIDQRLEAYRNIYNEEVKLVYSGYGYHGGGRKATGIKRVSICISGQPEQIKKLKELAALDRKTVSAFIFEKTGVTKMERKNITVTIFNNGEKNVYGWDNDPTLIERVTEVLNNIESEKISCLITYQYMKENSEGKYIGNGNVWNALSACCNDGSNWVSKETVIEELKKITE